MTKLTNTMLREMIREEITHGALSTSTAARKRSLRSLRGNNIAENFFTDAISSMGSGIAQRIKNAVCEYVLEAMGVPKDHFMGRVICNTFENLEMDELSTIVFGAESNDSSRCQELAENLLEGIAETLAEKLREEILPQSDSALFKFIEESIINSIVDNNELAKSTAEAICKAVSDAMDAVTPG